MVVNSLHGGMERQVGRDNKPVRPNRAAVCLISGAEVELKHYDSNKCCILYFFSQDYIIILNSNAVQLHLIISSDRETLANLHFVRVCVRVCVSKSMPCAAPAFHYEQRP